MTNKLASAGVLGPDAYEKIKSARLKWKRRETSDGFHAYEMTILETYEKALQKIPLTEFDRLVGEVVAEYKDQVYIYTRDLITRLKSENYFLIAISGSHHELVEKIAQHYNFDDFVGTKYERRGKTFSEKKYAPSLDKRSALQIFVNANDLTLEGSYAVGDSSSDAPMLEMVEHPIAFNPDKALYELARSNNWPIVVERKNMIYKLEPSNGQYILA